MSANLTNDELALYNAGTRVRDEQLRAIADKFDGWATINQQIVDDAEGRASIARSKHSDLGESQANRDVNVASAKRDVFRQCAAKVREVLG